MNDVFDLSLWSLFGGTVHSYVPYLFSLISYRLMNLHIFVSVNMMIMIIGLPALPVSK